MHQLLDRDGMLTVGTDEGDIDWEAMWRDQLARDDEDPEKDGTLLTTVWRCMQNKLNQRGMSACWTSMSAACLSAEELRLLRRRLLCLSD